MVVQRHNFSITASIDQRLSLVVFTSICLTSFLAWPSFTITWYIILRYACAMLLLSYLGWQFYQLKTWHCSFWIDEAGKAGLSKPNISCQLKRFWVSPFAVVFQLENDQSSHFVIVWRDMLDDTSYRHLCRLVLAHG
ncbi:protein YgfX [Shewanella colwelliana]|uniref:protein YgfX n=1 Tax=Shewanella colwelliana TaxID=23 RepID=UPI00048F4133|nr:protein YgfX [Shewanella colwelliana]